MKTKRKFPADYINRIILGDCLDVMKQIPDGSIDLVITSPPYNLKNSTGNGMKDGRGGKWSNAALINGYDNYDDNMPYDEYVVWQRNCLAEMLRIIPDHGAIFYNHKWRVQAGLLQDRQEIVAGPVALIDRIVESTTAKTVLDPFMGSGTTAIAARKNKRDYVGIELSPDYVNLANIKDYAVFRRERSSSRGI